MSTKKPKPFTRLELTQAIAVLSGIVATNDDATSTVSALVEAGACLNDAKRSQENLRNLGITEGFLAETGDKTLDDLIASYGKAGSGKPDVVTVTETVTETKIVTDSGATPEGEAKEAKPMFATKADAIKWFTGWLKGQGIKMTDEQEAVLTGATDISDLQVLALKETKDRKVLPEEIFMAAVAVFGKSELGKNLLGLVKDFMELDGDKVVALADKEKAKLEPYCEMPTFGAFLAAEAKLAAVKPKAAPAAATKH